jgi:hypothetical protein
MALDVSIKALEKQIAKKPIKKPTDDFCLYYDSYCPCCDAKLLFRYNHCVCCGQKISLDWGNEDAE